ncbi:MAG: o-succinylbenzoate synthase [Alkalinema sp. RU_4_3]|nr:o-succinylbenzoate synthase [Alkalinema sp. RU_4_3]
MHPYSIPFRHPLRTAHGTWSRRTGAIVTLTPPTGQPLQGEIAPLPSFGSETLAQALAWVESLQGTITTEQICAIPDPLPCCQFAFETALLPQLETSMPMANGCPEFTIAALLPAGPTALTHWQTPYQRGHRTFKWKIGCFPNELDLLGLLLAQLPRDTKLRLDANASLTLEQTLTWLDRLDRSPQIEYLEQPLNDLETLLAIAPQFSTPLALDESIASLQQLKEAYHQGWRGVFVIKPAIVGSPKKLIEFCAKFRPDTVFSSVFETPIGRYHGINLAHHCGSDRPLGYGTADWLLE